MSWGDVYRIGNGNPRPDPVYGGYICSSRKKFMFNMCGGDVFWGWCVVMYGMWDEQVV